MPRDFVWAIDEDGKPCKCFAKPENRGKRNCKHRLHAEEGETFNDFMLKYADEDFTTSSAPEEITQDEIDVFAARIDEITGVHVTEDNYEEVLMSLSPAQIDELNKLGFEAAPAFSLPVSDEMYNEVNNSNKIYFSELPNYHIGGKTKAIEDMFGSIGMVPVQDAESTIEHNYRDGLSAREYFEKQFSARGAQVQKTVSVAKPGATARLLFYAMADTQVISDCGNHESHGIMDCHAPGICKKCAAKSGFEVEEGQLVGSIISTHLTEGLTQASLSSIHSASKNKESKAVWESIRDVIHSYKSSPVIQKASEAASTREAREIIKNGLEESYAKAGIAIDSYNLEMVAKKLTSYKVNKGKLEYIAPGEMCDFPSLQAIGGHGNLFLQSELRYSYDKLAHEQTINNTENSVTAIA